MIDRVRQPLRDRSNIPSGVGSEYNYSTPATEKNKMAAERASGKVVVPSSKVGVVPFSRQEVVQLMEGVRKFGRKWSHILSVYDFHHSRTGTSLKDKFRCPPIPSNKCIPYLSLSIQESDSAPIATTRTIGSSNST